MSKALPFLLPALVLVGIVVYATWIRELPQAEGRITGEFSEARELAQKSGARLLVAVDVAPP